MFLDKFNRPLDRIVVDTSGVPVLSGLESGSPQSVRLFPSDRLVTFLSVLTRMGIGRVTFDGGEPLARPDIVSLLKQVARMRSVTSLSVATDGRWLPRFLQEMATMRIARLEVILPALDPALYRRMTGHDDPANALAGIRAAIHLGAPVSLKVPLVGGINQSQIGPLIDWAASERIDVLFVETPAVGADSSVSVEEAFRTATEERGFAREDETGRFSDGVVAAGLTLLSERTCADCRKMWLSADGTLTLCHGLKEAVVDVAAFFDENPTEADIISFVAKTPLNKPLVGDARCARIVP
jgi:cyclic pyranopterin phosphate synthase